MSGPLSRTSVPPVHRLRAAAFGLIVIVALGVSSCSSAPSAAPGVLAGKSPSAILQLALHDATEDGSMQFSIRTAGGTSQTVSGATSKAGGGAIVTSSDGQVHIVVIGKTGYIASPAGGLVATMGLAPSAAQTYAGRWLMLTSTDDPFSELQSTVSIETILDEFTPGGKLRLYSTTIDGHSVGLIDGTGTAQRAVSSYQVQLAVTTSRPVLPIGGVVQIKANGKTVTQTSVFSRWGDPVPLQAPPGAVRWDTLVPQ